MAVTEICVAQGSPEWFTARLGMPTCSRFADIIARGAGKVRDDYLYELVSERISRRPHESFSGPAMARGHEQEDEARRAYAFEHDVEVRQVGFIHNGMAGGSPDGLIGDEGLLEIKTLNGRLWVRARERNKFPPEHMAQCQGLMWITGRRWCDLLLFCPGHRLQVYRLERSEGYIAMLAAEIEAFELALRRKCEAR